MYFDLWSEEEDKQHQEQLNMIELRQRNPKSSLGGIYSRVNSEEEELNNIPQLNTSLISNKLKSNVTITRPTNCKI